MMDSVDAVKNDGGIVNNEDKFLSVLDCLQLLMHAIGTPMESDFPDGEAPAVSKHLYIVSHVASTSYTM
jgi:hypothetical protein